MYISATVPWGTSGVFLRPCWVAVCHSGWFGWFLLREHRDLSQISRNGPRDFFRTFFLTMFSRSLFCFHVFQMAPKVVKSGSTRGPKWSLLGSRDLIFSISLEITKFENGSRASRIQQGQGAPKCRCKPSKIYERTNMEQRTHKTRQKIPPEMPRDRKVC